MKKLLSLFLAVITVFVLVSTCFAEAEVTNGEEKTAVAPLRNVDVATYDEEQHVIEIEDEAVSQSGVVSLNDESIPKAMPKTGGIPAEAFYAAGALLIVAALLLMGKKTKAEQ